MGNTTVEEQKRFSVASVNEYSQGINVFPDKRAVKIMSWFANSDILEVKLHVQYYNMKEETFYHEMMNFVVASKICEHDSWKNKSKTKFNIERHIVSDCNLIDKLSLIAVRQSHGNFPMLEYVVTFNNIIESLCNIKLSAKGSFYPSISVDYSLFNVEHYSPHGFMDELVLYKVDG